MKTISCKHTLIRFIAAGLCSAMILDVVPSRVSTVYAVEEADVVFTRSEIESSEDGSWSPYKDYDINEDDILSVAEAQEIKKISIEDSQVVVSKLEYFPNLEYLSCSYCDLTRLDVSKNTQLQTLDCSGNKLTELNLSENTQLQTLNCSGNSLTELNLSENTQLQTLNCSENSLTELNLSENTQLQSLDCWENKLTKLDLSKNMQLQNMICSGNKLTELDLSKNTKLRNLYCGENKLTKLNISKNKSLEGLDCSNNKLKKLDVTGNKKLKFKDLYFDYASVNLVGVKYKKSLSINTVKENCGCDNVKFYAKKAGTVTITYTFGGKQKCSINEVRLYNSKTKVKDGFYVKDKNNLVYSTKNKKVHSATFKVKVAKGNNSLCIDVQHLDKNGQDTQQSKINGTARKVKIKSSSPSLVFKHTYNGWG